MPDMVIMNGLVIDGTGTPGVRADIAITGDKIEAIEPEINIQDCIRIDAAGKIVCPASLTRIRTRTCRSSATTTRKFSNLS